MDIQNILANQYLIFLCIIVFYLYNQIRILKLLPYFRFGPTGDAAAYYFHYRSGLEEKKKTMLTSSEVGLPPILFFKVATLIDKSIHEKFPYAIYILVDIVFYLLTLTILAIHSNSTPTELLILFFGIIVFSDTAVINSDNLQLFGFSPRLLIVRISGLLLLSIFVFDNPLIRLSLGYILAAYLLSSSHFSRQILFLLVIPITALFDKIALSGLVISILYAYFIDGKIKQILKGQIQLFQFQLKRFNEVKKVKKQKNNPKTIRLFFGLNSFSGIYSIGNFFFLALVATTLKDLTLFYCSIITLIVASLTAQSRLQFLGEPWRYLFFFNSAFTGLILLESNYVLELCIIKFVLNLIIQYISIQKVKRLIPMNANLKSLLHGLHIELRDAAFLCQDFRLGTLAINLGYGAKTTEFEIGALGGVEALMTGYPYLDFEKLTKYTNLSSFSHFLTTKDWFNKNQSKVGLELELLRENQDFYLFRIIDIKENNVQEKTNSFSRCSL